MDLINILLHGTVALDVFGWIVRIAALIVVPTNRRPSSAMAWLLTIFLVPYFGLIAFLVIGNPKLPKARREKQRRVNSAILELTAGIAPVPTDEGGPDWLESLVTLNRNLGAMPMVAGNDVQLIDEYGAAIDSMTAAVESAEQFVHCQFYILALDLTTAPFFAALEAAAARGVSVRVLLDHIGSLRSPHYRKTVRELKRIGVDWRLALPVQPYRGRYQRPDLRNHRKLLVIDGDVAFIGSQNMIDRSYNKRGNLRRGLLWQELMARLEGPVVGGVNALFLTDWFSETGEVLDTEIDPLAPRTPGRSLNCQVVPSGPGFDGENNLKLFNSLLYNAERRISITSPYFVPDESLLAAVTTAAERGVAVELFVSAIGDQPFVFHAQRSYYEPLLRAGVRIYLYPAPFILHAKHLTVDEHVGVLGSSNMDIRSFELNLEATLLVSGPAFVDDLRKVEDHYREISHELTLEEHLGRGLPRKVLDNLARLTSALQ